MTFAENGYMPLDRQLFDRSIAEVLAKLLAQRYRTAKLMGRAVGIDPATAENLYKGHLSIPTLQKVMRAEGRDLWNKLGDELFGETFYQFEERRIAAAIREAEHVRSNLVRLRSQGEELLAGAGLMDPAPARRASDADRAGKGGARSEADRDGDRPAQSARDRQAGLGRSFAPKSGGRR
jgi:hypothetical protein